VFDGELLFSPGGFFGRFTRGPVGKKNKPLGIAWLTNYSLTYFEKFIMYVLW
jgi:hypothetical protein